MRKLTHSLFLVATASPTLVSVNCQHDIDFSCSSTLVWSGLVWSMYSNLSKKDVLDKNLTQMVKSVREYDDNNNLSVIQASFPLGFSQTFSWDKFANLRRRKRWRPSSLRTITGAPWRETAWDTTLSSTPGDQPASQPVRSLSQPWSSPRLVKYGNTTAALSSWSSSSSSWRSCWCWPSSGPTTWSRDLWRTSTTSPVTSPPETLCYLPRNHLHFSHFDINTYNQNYDKIYLLILVSYYCTIYSK